MNHRERCAGGWRRAPSGAAESGAGGPEAVGRGIMPRNNRFAARLSTILIYHDAISHVQSTIGAKIE